jgi:hypothetical protein
VTLPDVPFEFNLKSSFSDNFLRLNSQNISARNDGKGGSKRAKEIIEEGEGGKTKGKSRAHFYTQILVWEILTHT